MTNDHSTGLEPVKTVRRTYSMLVKGNSKLFGRLYALLGTPMHLC